MTHSLTAISRTGNFGITPPPSSPIDPYYQPPELSFIAPDHPNVLHVGVDINYPMMGVDLLFRTKTWSIESTTASFPIAIDANTGIISGTPTTDNETFSTTVGLSFDGGNKITKTFTSRVNNSRYFFYALTGSDVTGDGSLANPFQTYVAALEAAYDLGVVGATVCGRAGTHILPFMEWETTATKLRNLKDVDFADTDPFTNRGYPGEIVELDAGAHVDSVPVWFEGENVNHINLRVTGADKADRAGINIGHKQAGRFIKAYGMDFDAGGNCTGIQARGVCMIDNCEAYDNASTVGGPYYNSSNWLYYGTLSGTGFGFIQNSLSSGGSPAGFKQKHAGDCSLILVDCVGWGSETPFMGCSNKSSVRRCFFHSDSTVSDTGYPLYVGRTDKETGGINNTDEGMLFHETVAIAGANCVGALYNRWDYLDTTPLTPLQFLDCDIESYSSVSGNTFIKGRYTNEVVDPAWTMIFDNNEVYAASPSNAVRIDEGTQYTLQHLFDTYGTGNTTQSPRTFTKTVQGRTFQSVNGVFSEV